MELRKLPLHLYELSLYCNLLANQRPVFSRKKGNLLKVGDVHTNTIANWLRLAAQIETVVLDTHIFQVADLYCDPVYESLLAEAKHHQQIITPLTRTMFTFNALEECYRLLSQPYKALYDHAIASEKSTEYLKNYSAQAAYVMRLSLYQKDMPLHYDHLVENYIKIVRVYLREFPGKFDVNLNGSSDADYSLALIRNIRNHIAHGIFPIIDDPDSMLSDDHHIIKVNLINLLNQSTRLAALNIQLLVALAGNPFESELYRQHQLDDEYGEFFQHQCNTEYLLNIHLINDFGLNESGYFEMLRQTGVLSE